MEDQKLDGQMIGDKVREYFQIQKELALLTAAEKGSQLFANLITTVLVVLFGILGLFFGSLALCFYLSELIGNSYAGFLIVTGIYLLLAIIIYAIKDKYLEKHIINAAIKKIFSDRNKNQ
jgi:uncharacterized membrane protein YbhN (UPF0104 family)